MTVPEGCRGLRFPCECVSSRRGGYSEPWASVAKNKLLPDGTKEEILNLVAQEPRTISQLAEALENYAELLRKASRGGEAASLETRAKNIRARQR